MLISTRASAVNPAKAKVVRSSMGTILRIVRASCNLKKTKTKGSFEGGGEIGGCETKILPRQNDAQKNKQTKTQTYLAMARFSTAKTTQSLPCTPTTVLPRRTACVCESLFVCGRSIQYGKKEARVGGWVLGVISCHLPLLILKLANNFTYLHGILDLEQMPIRAKDGNGAVVRHDAGGASLLG